jgi:hypothetical protein
MTQFSPSIIIPVNHCVRFQNVIHDESQLRYLLEFLTCCGISFINFIQPFKHGKSASNTKANTCEG